MGVTAVRVDDHGHHLDNGLVSVSIGTDGTLTSVVDLASGREVLPAGMPGNLLQLHPDLSNS